MKTQKLLDLEARRSAKASEVRALAATIEAEKRDLTAEESSKIDTIKAELTQLDAAIERQKFIDTEAAAASLPTITGGEDRSRLDPKGGFNSFAEFAGAVFKAGTGQVLDSRLTFEAGAPSTFGRESVGADGGYLVPQEFSSRVWEHSLEEGSFVPLTDNNPVSGNSMSFPKDDTTPWGTNGIRAYWQGEGAAATQTKPVLGEFSLRLKRLTALVPVTDELLADGIAVGNYVSRKAGASIAWKANQAIAAGDGNGKPLGYTVAGSLVTVSKETNQTAATIVAGNVAKMFGRLPRITPSTRWLINHDAINQLPLMTVGQQPVWHPNFQVSPYGTLLGIPVLPSQVCATLGTTLDIQLVNFADYVTITKAGGIDTATSMHLFFDAHATAFRLTFRMDGQPWYTSAISPANGSSNLSGFVTVETRG